MMAPNKNSKDKQLQSYILDLQAGTETAQLWQVFLQILGHLPPAETAELKEAQLMYRAGVLQEAIFIDPVTGEMVHQAVTNETFPDSKKNFEYDLKPEQFVAFKRNGSHCIQMSLEFQTARFKNIAPEEHDELLLYTHIFFNQVFLLLKIKNFEFHSIKDDITLAYNQNYLKAFMQSEIERSKRYASVFSVVFFDLDNLKAINEVYGHLVGTEVLKEVASVLRAQVRKMDLLSRFGGDEFVIVLLHANAQRSCEVCARIKDALKKTVFLKTKGLDIKITGCFGISSFPENGNDVDELIRKADIAMYDIKRTGKDGIKIYQGES